MAKKTKKNNIATSVDQKAKGKKQVSDETLPADDGRQKQKINRAKVSSTTSWTGKLPHTLLHELCQKRKWGRVEYDMKRIGKEGYVGIAVISHVDPKTNETLTVRMTDPTYDGKRGALVPQETSLEARHMAATIALYRLAYNTNMHMMLPPNHRDLWKTLDEYRKKLDRSDANKSKYLFDLDPFKTLLEVRKVKEQKLIENVVKEQKLEKQLKQPVLLSFVNNDQTSSKSGNKKRSPMRSVPTVNFPKKVWENAVLLDLDEKSRHLIESYLKLHIDWNDKLLPEKFAYTEEEHRVELRRKLLEYGFRKTHVDEAMKYKDPLSFLLFHLSDDLPPFFRQSLQDSKSKIELTSMDLSKRIALDNVSEFGISRKDALFALELTSYNETAALVYLTHEMCRELDFSPHLGNVDKEYDDQNSIDLWNEELESLKAIAPDDVRIAKTNNSYFLDVIKKGDINIKVKLYRSKDYPNAMPGIVVSTFDRNYKLPDYIKRKILEKLIIHIKQSGLLGDMLGFTICDWLRENVIGITQNPGPLLSDEEIRISVERNSKFYSKSSVTHYSSTTRNVQPRLTSSQLLKLKEKDEVRKSSPQYKMMQDIRSKLPAWNKKDLIVKLVNENDVVLITGETGSGKSTQVVQFILDNIINTNTASDASILCTQPRRISAIGLGERVSEERCVKCGDEVGYIIRGVNKTGKTTRIKFMTTGVLVRMLQSDKSLLKNTYVVVDEVHERSIDTDLVITLLKSFLGKVPGMKLIMMSATVNVELLRQFFPNLATCHIEGRTFPIKDIYLEEILLNLDFKIKKDRFRNSYSEDGLSGDEYLKPGANSRFFKEGNINYDLVVQVVSHVDSQLLAEKNDGSIIVFMPGVAEINKCCNMIMNNDSKNHFIVLPLHSALSPDDQKKVFRKFDAKRKVVLATNIAETSITIDDCVAIIDTGKVKTMLYNPNENTTRLVEGFISKAEAQQRRGRAGRVRAGLCYRLYSRESFEEMKSIPVPEIHRIALESLYLAVKSMGIKDVSSFLNTGLDPPPFKSLIKAEQLLITTGLLNSFDKGLTELGKFISIMPVMDSRHGKLLIYSIIFGCTDLGILLASILSAGGSPFVAGIENREKIKKILSKYEFVGDLLGTSFIVKEYMNLKDRGSKNSYLKEYLLSYNKMHDISSSVSQLTSNMKDIGFLPMNYNGSIRRYFNRNETNISVLRAIITGAFYPNVSRIQLPDAKYLATRSGALEKDPDSRAIKFWIRNEGYQDKLLETAESEMNIAKHKTGSEDMPLPATRAFMHPSSALFQTNNTNAAEQLTLAEFDSTTLSNKTRAILKFPFTVFTGSQMTSKLFIKDLTPTTAVALLLFGGPLTYELGNEVSCPGIVVDNWLPIRTWCKNGVYIKEVRTLLDKSIKLKLGNPKYDGVAPSEHSSDGDKFADTILNIVEEILSNEQ